MKVKRVLREKDIETLEFDLIRAKLAALTATPMARELALSLMPSPDPRTVHRLLQETGEGRLLCARGSFTPPGAADIEPMVLRAQKGGVLSGAELAAAAAFLRGVRRWQKFMEPEEHRALYPLMAGLVASLNGCPSLEGELNRSVDDEGKVLDGASPLLAELRRRQRALQERIRERLEGYLRDPGTRRYLQEALITIRNGRYVLPVKQEYRRQVEGVLHDQSSSGATLFIEPLPVVQLQNQLTALAGEEEREIERILRHLSARVGEQAGALLSDRAVFTQLDLIAARGRLSLELKGAEPELLEGGEPRLHLVEARHPLLAGEAVPLTVTLGGENRVLVITGPNTGGKTVALKTIGLMAAMAQSGLHIPAAAESKLFVFDAIRADIGDEQSIAQSLSTFSAHLKNIIAILAEAGPKTLALFDELGAGTDPSEGAALAMAILAELARVGTLTVATTHINELKLFAQVQEGMQNAAMEFDAQTLSPTYRLLQGVPGQSNAFVIAGKLGLPAGVLEEARGFLHREHARVEEIIASLVEDRRRLSLDSRQAALERSRAEALMEELEREKEKLMAKREEILQQAREEARHLLRHTKRSVDELIRELRRLQATGGTEALGRAEELRRTLHDLRREMEPEEEQEGAAALAEEELTPGRTVLVHSLGQKGEIIAPAGEEVLVQVGAMRVQVPRRDLRPWRDRGAAAPETPRGGYTVRKEDTASSQVDLRGMTVEEAVPVVEKFLDNALWAGFSQVTLIHGKGTGKLKAGLRSYLQGHRLVRGFRPGAPPEGGDGVTVVDLSAGG